MVLLIVLQIISITLLQFSSASENRYEIIDEGENIIYDYGTKIILKNITDTAHLTCKFDLDSGYTSNIWSAKGSVTVLNGALLISPDKFTVLESEEYNSQVIRDLKVVDLKHEDEGKYTCLCLAECDVKPCKQYRINYEIVIYEPPTIEIESEGQQVDSLEKNSGDELYLDCKIIGGTPTPNVTWTRKSGLPLAQYNGELHIASIGYDDEDEYTCIANNGMKVYSTFTLLVIYDPFLYKSSPVENSAKLEQDLSLFCEFYSNHDAKFSWQFNGTEIYVDDNVTINGHAYRTVFNITNMKHRDFGEYTCLMSTYDADVRHSMSLTGYAGPVQYTSSDVSKYANIYTLKFEVVSEEKMIDYLVEYRKRGSLKWKSFKMNTKVVLFVREEYREYTTLKDLQSSTVYEVRVASRNTFGRGKFSDIFNFTTSNKLYREQKSSSEIQSLSIALLLSSAIFSIFM